MAEDFESGIVTIIGDDARVIGINGLTTLAPPNYTLNWATLSLDSSPLGNSFGFVNLSFSGPSPLAA